MTYKNDTFKIAFSGIMFSLVLLFQFLEKFMKLNMGFVNLNISILFILITHFVAGYKYTIILFILRFLLGPGIGSSGYTSIGFWSHFILLTYDMSFYAIFILVYKWSGSLLLSILLSIAIVSLIAGPLNGALFTPVFWAIMEKGYGLPINLTKAAKSYAYVHDVMFFGINDYWGGMFAVYTLANLIKFSLVGFLIFTTWKTLMKTNYKKYLINTKINQLKTQITK